MNSYVDVILNAETGLHHGALFMNKPTPSGADRFLLSMTVTDGSPNAREAGLAGNAAFSGARPVDVDALSVLDLRSIEIPEGCMVTKLTPRTPEARADAVPEIEIRVGKSRRAMGIDAATLGLLVHIGRLEPDSCSGDDPELHYVYDHFVPGPKA